MPMNPNFLCCIGAELKNSTQQTTRMTQVYLYRAFESETIADMLSAGFFNQALGIIRQDDLLLLYSPNETNPRWVYARVSSATRDGIEISKVDIQAQDISVDTTDYSNLSGNNLQEILNNLDTTITTINNAFVKKDGSSIMTGPLKMRAGSMQGAIAAYWDGVGFFKLNSNDSVTLLASMEATDGLCPAADNTYNIGKTNYKWKDAYIARVITAVLNNGYDIAVPVTNSADTLALKSEVDLAANSGRMITDQGVWYAKMYAATVAPSAENGTNYADFSQTDGQGNPTIVIYERQNGAWVQSETITPPAEYDGYVPITSKIWDIPEQAGQQGGRILWNHQSKEFTPYPQIISFENAALTGTPTAPTLNASSPSDQIVNKQTLENALINHGTGRNVGDIFFTMRTDSTLNGAVECNGAQYNTTDFTGGQSIGQLLEAGKVPFVSLTQYATLLSTNGSVGVFGWDGVGTTPFRVPSLNDIFIESGTAAQIGDYLAPGLPNITGTWRAGGGNNQLGPTSLTGSYYKVETGNNTNPTYAVGGTAGTVGFDASRSSSVYKNGVTTVQPNTVRYRPMVQLAVSASDEAVETCTSVLADVAALKYDYVVDFQAPTAENNYTWYRKYKSGWVEQGGQFTATSVADGAGTAGNNTINLPITMANDQYWYSANIQVGGSGWEYANGVILNARSTTTLTLKALAGTGNIGLFWEVKGMAA